MKNLNDIQLEVEAFLREYETATNSHNFENVRPLILSKAEYFFSNENLNGIDEIANAFIETFSSIKEETYTISDVRWTALSSDMAVCLYKFHWVGLVDGEQKSGEGRGTNVLIKKDGRWFMAHEHLSSPRD